MKSALDICLLPFSIPETVSCLLSWFLFSVSVDHALSATFPDKFSQRLLAKMAAATVVTGMECMAGRVSTEPPREHRLDKYWVFQLAPRKVVSLPFSRSAAPFCGRWKLTLTGNGNTSPVSLASHSFVSVWFFGSGSICPKDQAFVCLRPR